MKNVKRNRLKEAVKKRECVGACPTCACLNDDYVDQFTIILCIVSDNLILDFLANEIIVVIERSIFSCYKFHEDDEKVIRWQWWDQEIGAFISSVL